MSGAAIAPSEGVVVKRAAVDRDHIVRRKAIQLAWPGTRPETNQILTDDMVGALDQAEYVGLVMTEPNVRATISVFKLAEQMRLIEVCSKHLPMLIRRALTYGKPRALAITKESRIGYPWCEMRTDKAALVQHVVGPEVKRKDLSRYQSGYTLVNIRLQQEVSTKVRTYPVLSPGGEYYNIEIKGDLRRIKWAPEKWGFAAKARPVYCPPAVNLIKQIVDTMLHDYYIEQPLCHFNMTALIDNNFRLCKYHRAGDVKHYERNIGSIVRLRAPLIGEGYNELQTLISDAPCLSVATDWRTPFFVAPDREAGYETQLASGDSCVAAVAKEVMICLFTEFFMTRFHLSQHEAMSRVLAGGDPHLVCLMMYGDDVVFHGEVKEHVDGLFDFMASYLTLEEETPIVFLGYQYDHEIGFFLRSRSFALNFWKPEHSAGSLFREYPWLGMLLRERVYLKYGGPGIEQIVAHQYAVLERYRVSKARIIQAAERDAKRVASRALPYHHLVGKDYLLTPDEMEIMGKTSALPYSDSVDYFNHLVHPEYRKAA